MNAPTTDMDMAVTGPSPATIRPFVAQFTRRGGSLRGLPPSPDISSV
jgi:hypothetical protein